MRFLCSFVLFLGLSTWVSAQHFEWAASGSNIFTGYDMSHITDDGRLVAGGQYYRPDMHFDGATEFNSSKSKSFPFSPHQNQIFVICYNAEGGIDWGLSGADFPGAKLNGIASRRDGTVIISFSTQFMSRPYYRADKPGEQQQDQDDYGNYLEQKDLHRYVFFAEISTKGTIGNVTAVPGLTFGEWYGLKSSPDGALIAVHADDKRMMYHGRDQEILVNHITKIGKDYSIQWDYEIAILRDGCCTLYPETASVSPNGDIYFSGVNHMGVRMSGIEDHYAPIYDSVTVHNQPYESYLGCLTPTGQLKWVNFSESKAFISDISASNDQVVIGGKIIQRDKLFGAKVDTTGEKLAFLMAFDTDGKRNWTQTFNALDITAVTQDDQGQIYAAYKSDRATWKPPLKIGKDTISDTFHAVVVGSFDANGKYQYYKYSRAHLNSVEPKTKLHTDHCGNVYLTGEMWYVLPINMALLDGALVSCRGYGGSPLAAKIRTTIPDELLALNEPIAEKHAKRLISFPISGIKRDQNQSQNGRDSTTIVNSLPTKDTTLIATIEPIRQGNEPDFPRQGCVPIPKPWELLLLPNPTSGKFTARATISFADDKIQLELWNVRGAFIKSLDPPKLYEVGTFDIEVDISDQPAGVYLVVLRGRGSTVTQRLVLVH
jgi:hypothetical protein